MSDKSKTKAKTRTRTIKTYRDLLIWQKGHELTLCVINICRRLPTNEETKIIKRQVLRAASAIPANIAEGFGSHKGKGFASYLRVARGTVTETDYWLFLLNDLGYIDTDVYNDVSAQCTEEVLMLSSMIRKIAGEDN